MRYQVFKTKEGGQPVFTAPWYWLASAIAHWSSLNWDACRIVDSKVDETRLCWAKALPAGKKSNLDGVIMRLGFVKIRGFSVPGSHAGGGPSGMGRNLYCEGCGVSDGDTVKVLTEQSCDSGKDCRSGKIQYRVRLAEIDTPEKKQPYGSKAKQALSDLVFGRMIKVEQIDKDRYGRLVANLMSMANGSMPKWSVLGVRGCTGSTPKHRSCSSWRPKPKPISEVSGHYRNRRELPLGVAKKALTTPQSMQV